VSRGERVARSWRLGPGQVEKRTAGGRGQFVECVRRTGRKTSGRQAIRGKDTPERVQKLGGTRPEGTRNEREAAACVQQMFRRIAPRYDVLNLLISFSLDGVWRRRTALRFARLLQQPGSRVLDLCCGTGDLAFALSRASNGSNCEIVGVDFVEAMLTRAQAKARDRRQAVTFVGGDALRLPFPDDSFDLVTSAFGFRNLANYESGLREIARVLRPGGRLGILDFSEPDSGVVGAVFRFYFRNILPRIGGAISGSRDDYAYLPASVRKFPSRDELTSLIARCGFVDAKYDVLNFGSILLYDARR
jgi:demethylmenaquinone methyltransferase / 2-methoxy-6-polyprenyl-1,4-benzoquinol methylase